MPQRLFEVYGGFEIDRDAISSTSEWKAAKKEFWKTVNQEAAALRGACGCYIFALQHGTNIVPWYVGKTERRTFENECFGAHKIIIYREVLKKKTHGTPLLFLVPRKTPRGRFSKPGIKGHKDVDFLETAFIGMALERNKKLMNVQKTRMLSDMIVPGVINPPRGRRPQPVQDLRNALGLLDSKRKKKTS